MYTIATHNGRFHSDDVFALAAFWLLLGKDKVTIIRTRDEAIIATAEYVVDVGQVYDHEQKRYDHHQLGAPVRENGIPYAGFGLMWRHYGEAICGSAAVAEGLDKSLCQPIDAGDNAVSLYTLNEFEVAPLELHTIISSYVPSDLAANYGVAFIEATEFAYALLTRMITHGHEQQAVMDYVQGVYDAAADKSVLVFDRSISRNLLIQYPEVMVMVYPSEHNGLETWRASVVPKAYRGFANRVEFPAAWAGLGDTALAEVSHFSDAIFCHKGRYLFSAKSKESAIQAAKQAV